MFDNFEEINLRKLIWVYDFKLQFALEFACYLPSWRSSNFKRQDFFVWNFNILFHKYYFVLMIYCFLPDDDIKEYSKVPCILHMDSIKGSHSGLKNIIQRFVYLFLNLNIFHLLDLF